VRALLVALSLLACSACGATQKPKQPVAQLRTLVEPATARVEVDEQFVGAARVLAQRPARLSVGRHRVTIEAPGYFPHDLELDLAVGVTKVEVKLRAIPP
jgi:hypothetical protein